MIDAARAREIGLVNQIFGAEELLPAAQEMAARLAARSPLALAAALRAVNDGLELGQADGCRLEAAIFGVCASTEDAREGCAAFLEKREPEFKGR